MHVQYKFGDCRSVTCIDNTHNYCLWWSKIRKVGKGDLFLLYGQGSLAGASLCVQRLRFVLPWLTPRPTDKHTDTDTQTDISWPASMNSSASCLVRILLCCALVLPTLLVNKDLFKYKYRYWSSLFTRPNTAGSVNNLTIKWKIKK